MLPYLIKALPLENWQPSPADLELLSLWLLNHAFESTESQIARITFSRLNWNFTSDGCALFLPYELHLKTAYLICAVATKHVPETVGLTDILVTSLVKNQTSRQQFSLWCWNMACRLRLHAMDQSRLRVQQMISRPEELLPTVPELETAEQALCQGVGESRPLAIFLALLITMSGHSVPQICEQGLDFIKLLLNDSRHSMVIRCLELVAPLFLNCPESLSSCDKFQHILTQLCNDKSYSRHTKDFIVLTNPKPVLQLMADMLQAQVGIFSLVWVNVWSISS